MRFGAMAIGFALAVGLFATAVRAGDLVHLDSGDLKGVITTGVVSFKGIPYAAPPLGPLRWRPPAPPANWEGVRDASGYGAICMQKAMRDNGIGPGPASEDCLTLNVFAPADGVGPAPVMVWIHGGGLVNGSGTAALYDGSSLARQGVVVVTLNYRLGRFGFFAHPALTAEARGQSPVANYGLMDQIAALKWVQRNIAAFGGDPENVTIFGESSGGQSVHRLMMAVAARGLFHKAISQSGLGRERGQTLAQAEAAGAAFAAGVGVRGNDPAALRAIPANVIVAGGDLEVTRGEAPILDGRMLTEDADRAFAAGRVAKVPFLVGSNSLELPPAWMDPRRRGVARFSDAQKSAMLKLYGGTEVYDDHIVSDIVFTEPARALARDQARRGAPTYLYRFSVLSSGAPKMLKGAPHASERQYVFETLNASPWPTDARDAALARTISAYWVAFARNGDPNGPGRPAWPRYDAADRLMNFTNEGPIPMTTPDAVALDAIAASLWADAR